jgi:hypothetical protein
VTPLEDLLEPSTPVNTIATPPDAANDLLRNSGGESLTPPESPEVAVPNTQQKQIGGSLYAALLEATKVAAPAAVLTAFAMTRKRKSKKTRQSRRSRRV